MRIYQFLRIDFSSTFRSLSGERIVFQLFEVFLRISRKFLFGLLCLQKPEREIVIFETIFKNIVKHHSTIEITFNNPSIRKKCSEACESVIGFSPEIS
jgi:hypothetical protein